MSVRRTSAPIALIAVLVIVLLCQCIVRKFTSRRLAMFGLELRLDLNWCKNKISMVYVRVMRLYLNQKWKRQIEDANPGYHPKVKPVHVTTESITECRHESQSITLRLYFSMYMQNISSMLASSTADIGQSHIPCTASASLDGVKPTVPRRSQRNKSTAAGAKSLRFISCCLE